MVLNFERNVPLKRSNKGTTAKEVLRSTIYKAWQIVVRDMTNFNSQYQDLQIYLVLLGEIVKVGHEYVKPWYIWSSGLGRRLHQKRQEAGFRLHGSQLF